MSPGLDKYKMLSKRNPPVYGSLDMSANGNQSNISVIHKPWESNFDTFQTAEWLSNLNEV